MVRRASLIIAAGLGMLALTACGATTGSVSRLAPPPPVNNVRPVEGGAEPTAGALPPQSLADGECATFFWTVDEAHRFLVFENETEGFARIFATGAAHGFYVPPREGGYVSGDAYQRTYVDTDRQLDIRLTGVIGDPLETGLRIDRAVMRIEQPNGQRVVIPLLGHYRCRARAATP